jgi:TRAP-type uncharacterized transport system substrate-binding protein
MQIDGYFTQYDNPNPVLVEISQKVNCTLIDLYSDGNKDTNNKIVPPEKIQDQHFYLTKDKMKLDSYPELVSRRKDTIQFYNLPYDSKVVNCYSFKMLMISRSDVEDEWIYLFTKSIMEKLERIKQEVPYLRDLTVEGMYKSTLSDILPIHPAVFGKDTYSAK